jgi:hypothetical protein
VSSTGPASGGKLPAPARPALSCHFSEQSDNGAPHGASPEGREAPAGAGAAGIPRPPSRKARGDGPYDPDTWRPRAGATRSRSVRLCETGRGWMVHGPDVPARASDVLVRGFRCWSASCRRCGPIVGAQDLARLEPTITGRRWLYVVVTLDPKVLAALQQRAHARRLRALERWRADASELVGAPPDSASSLPLDRFILWDARPGPRARDVAKRELAALRWFEVARDVLPLPRGRDLSTNPYFVASAAWSSRLRRSLRHRFGAFESIVTWERHRSGLPHANVLLELEPFEAELGKLRRRTVDGRERVYPPALRSWMRTQAMAAGFGRVFHLEVAEPRSAALGCYVAKLSRELMASAAKGPTGQAPLNRPRGFRRFSATQHTLPARLWPKGRRIPCTVPGCAVGEGLCSRTLARHLVDVHAWPAARAREHVRALLLELAPSRVAILEADRPSAAAVASKALLLGPDPVSSAAWRAVSEEIRNDIGFPLFMAEDGTTAPLRV